jgi:hypothetical protein
VEGTPVHGRVRVLRLPQGRRHGYPGAFGFQDRATPPEDVTALLDRHAAP